jgi:hypothetical protein
MGFQQFCKTGRGALEKILMESKKNQQYPQGNRNRASREHGGWRRLRRGGRSVFFAGG